MHISQKTRRNSKGFRQRLCFRLSWPWPCDPMSMSQAQVHTWPNFGHISSNINDERRYCIYPVFRIIAMPAVTLTFDFWSKKLVSTTNPDTSVNKIGWNSLHWFLRYGGHKVFGTHRLSHTHSQTDRPECSMLPARWHRFLTVSEA